MAEFGGYARRVRRVGVAVAVGVLVTLAGCAAPQAAVNSQPGVRIEGSVRIDAQDGDACWTATYVEDGTEVAAPLGLPDGFETRDIVMADPSNPGNDFDGPALMNSDGSPVGFSGGTAIVRAKYAALDDPDLAEQRERCGWTSAPLVVTGPDGIWVDPDGLAETIYICSDSPDENQEPSELAAHLDECDKTTREPVPNASVAGDD